MNTIRLRDIALWWWQDNGWWVKYAAFVVGVFVFFKADHELADVVLYGSVALMAAAWAGIKLRDWVRR